MKNGVMVWLRGKVVEARDRAHVVVELEDKHGFHGIQVAVPGHYLIEEDSVVEDVLKDPTPIVQTDDVIADVLTYEGRSLDEGHGKA